MSQVELDIPYTDPRNRLTVAFRLILAIPHMILAAAWQYAVQITALIQWFICVFTGKRNEGLWRFGESYLGYAARVNTYQSILYDEYPKFGTDSSGSPVRYSLAYPTEPANRLTIGLRFLWIIPAVIIAIGVTIAGAVLGIISWFAILFTGTMPRGMFDFVLQVQRYGLRLLAYSLLLTDTYPSWS